MEIYVPADLGGVGQLMVATRSLLRLVFGDGCGAGEVLNSLYILASHVTVDSSAWLEMNGALRKRGLTLGMATAGPEHERFPSQCMYVRPGALI